MIILRAVSSEELPMILRKQQPQRLLFWLLPLVMVGLLMTQTAMAAQPLKLLKLEERQLDGAPAIMALFSHPLDATILYERHIRVQRNQEPLNRAWVVGDNPTQLFLPRVDPKQRYRIHFAAGLRGKKGELLGSEQSREITIRDVKPAFGFAGSKTVLPASIAAGLPVMTVNVPEVDIEFLQVKPSQLPHFLKQYLRHWDNAPTQSQMERVSHFTKSVFRGRFTTDAPANTRHITHIPVQNIDALTTPGLYLAVMSHPGHFGWYRATMFTITDIGLHVRHFADRIEIFTQSLADGQPMPQVALTLRDGKGKTRGRAVTDAAGHARIAGSFSSHSLLTAHSGDQLSLLSFNEPALDLSNFAIEGPAHQPVSLFPYTPRDLFRPGESFPLSVLVRDHDGHPIIPRPITARLLRPDGRESARFTLREADSAKGLGYLEQWIELPADAPTGRWRIELRADPAAKRANTTVELSVEEFLPERMKLELTTDRAYLLPKQRLSITTQGHYLYGAPAAGNRLQRVLHRRFNPHPVASLKDFFFGNAKLADKLRERTPLADVTLGKEGQHQFSLDGEADAAPVSLKVVASLLESGGRPVTRAVQRTVWPAEALVGVRPVHAGDWVPPWQHLTIEILRARPDGSLTSAQGLDVTVIHEERQYHWVYNKSGWRVERHEEHYPALQTQLNIQQGAVGKVTVPIKWGAYRIEVTDPSSGLTTLHRFQAGREMEARQRTAGVRPDQVGMTLDKDGYRPGDTARLTLKPPHAGEALILVESDHILWQKRITLAAEGGEVEVPIDPAWNRHDIHLSALVFRSATAGGDITPNRAVGIIHLPLERTSRRLEVALTAPEKMVPEQELTMTVKLANRVGKQAMVTVAAVDLGILQITDFKTPTPWQHFFSRKRLLPTARDLYGRIIEQMDGSISTMRFGGDADISRMRRGQQHKAQPRLVSLFSGPVTVDAQGQAEIKLPVPDFNGRLRIMATAFSATQFGHAEGEVTVAAPLVAEAALPRFLATGDRSQMTLDLHNLSGNAQPFKVSLRAQPPLVAAPMEKVITLANDQRTTLTLPIATSAATGVGVAKVEITGEGVDLQRSWPITIRSPFPAQRVVQEQVVSAGQQPFTLDAKNWLGLVPESAELWLQISDHPLFDIRSLVKGLVGYPYGCLEQTTSRAFPMLFVDEAMARENNLAVLDRKERSKRIDAAMVRLKGMWRSSGGYGLWNSNSPLEPWLTAYVGDFLLTAKEQGFSVDEALLKKSLEQLIKQLKGVRTTLRHGSDAASIHGARAYAGYVVARTGRAALSDLRALAQRIPPKGQAMARIHLGLALRLQGDHNRGQTLLDQGVDALEKKERIDDYGSPIRNLALTTALFSRHQINGDKVAGLLERLLRQLRDRRYLSTQEKLAVLLAATPAAKERSDTPLKAVVSRAGAATSYPIKGRMGQLWVGAEQWKDLTIEPPEQGQLFIRATLTGFPLRPPKAERSVVDLHHTLYTMDGMLVEERPLKTGELFVLHLQATSKRAMEHGLVEALLPAGLELENPAIMKGESLGDLQLGGIKPALAMHSGAIRHQEFREDRYVAAVSLKHGVTNLYAIVRAVAPGDYSWPPLRVEDMYRPTRRGTGDGGTLQVIQPAAP
uniref:Alpha-2-macroglobulin n=1 Tax=Magnetococcus massalia (strain MO-1) TaxID=451514 RepID=A0A1S7LGX4_MAGMO|nr:conserved exported protein of unknown function [Candidatus Magnetococcus massalia]